MSQFDRSGRPQGDFQQEGFTSPHRQQGSQQAPDNNQGLFGQEDRGRESDWRRQQGSGDRFRDSESSDQGNAWRNSGPTGQGRRQDDPSNRGYGAQQGPERAPYESNYGFESSHPSYKARGAGDWSRSSGQNQDDHEQRDEFDPDYHQWRRDQLQSLNNDYRRFRQERFKKFSDEFSTWRTSRASGAGKQGKDKDQDK